MNILDELFETSDEKVVIFSQWKRMTYLVSKELDIRGVPYEHLHGGVPSEKRKNLFDRFNNDPDCRVFLSTDAGSTGLNLQSASMLINLDIPWNPAVLEQRIARIHRMGQKNNVSVINFVAQGTIEHRMLSVLDFKSALSQGILDNGEDAIFMDADKFTKFMETVEAVTGDASNEAVVSTEEEMEAVEMGSIPSYQAIEDTENEGALIEADEEDDFIDGEEDDDYLDDEDESNIESDEEEDYDENAEEDDDEDYDNEDYVERDEDEDDYDEEDDYNEEGYDEDYDEYNDGDYDESDGEDDYIEGDDDIVPIETVASSQAATSSPIPDSPQVHPQPQDLLAGGIRFLSGLAQTLSSPEATQQLVSSIVERDEKTGRSYMKIPVDDQQTVVNVMNMLGQLFKGFGK
jgi:SNF2 family DNA or RNA helicase